MTRTFVLGSYSSFGWNYSVFMAGAFVLGSCSFGELALCWNRNLLAIYSSLLFGTISFLRFRCSIND